jgi:purine-cytosine permease-like protein
MTPRDATARNRWLAMVGSRIAGSLGAVFGLVLAARAPDWPVKALGVAITLSALAVVAIVPASLAQRWRTPRR